MLAEITQRGAENQGSTVSKQLSVSFRKFIFQNDVFVGQFLEYLGLSGVRQEKSEASGFEPILNGAKSKRSTLFIDFEILV